MAVQLHEFPLDTDQPLPNAIAISRCLKYLEAEAARAGLPFAALLISVAAEAVNDSISLSQRITLSPSEHYQ